MCLGVPGRILEIDGLVARVDFWGQEREVRLDQLDQPVRPGDFVVSHVGFAVRRIPDAEIEATLALYDELLAEIEREDAWSGVGQASDPGETWQAASDRARRLGAQERR